jgi:hypothetical protein
MRFWASSESDRFCGPALVASEKLVEPLIIAALAEEPLADLEVKIRYVPIVMDEQGQRRYPARSRVRKAQRLYDCAPQLDYLTFKKGRSEEQLAEYLRGLEECRTALPKLGATPPQVQAFMAALDRVARELTARLATQNEQGGPR